MNSNSVKFFKDIYKQKFLIKELRNILNNKDTLFHAFLFSGVKGTGKTTLANIFATSINCEYFNLEACYNCNACLNPLDIMRVDGSLCKSFKEIESILPKLKYAPVLGRKRILILDEVHKLTTDALSAFLTLTQEPPKNLVIIFITNEPGSLPKTLLSRFIELKTDLLNFEDTKELINILLDKYKPQLFITLEELYLFLFSLSEGSYRENKIFLENISAIYPESINQQTIQNFNELIALFIQKDKNGIILFCFNLVEQKCDIRNFLKSLSQWLFIRKELLELALIINYYCIIVSEKLTGLSILKLILNEFFS